MREVVLEIDDAIDIKLMLSMLAPLGKRISVLTESAKIWNGNMDWLGKPYQVDSFKPLSRDEIYDR